ncbi:MAG: TonB-dependent receptor, partial [Chitinophagaceae bacterium]
MKSYKYIIMLCLIFPGLASLSQVNKSPSTSTASFKVSGACEWQCKPRIEAAAKGKGVNSAIWNVNNKELSIVYDSSKTTIDKIQNRIVTAGHDVENKKAKDIVYNNLPECCRYRKMETMVNDEGAADSLGRADTNSVMLKIDSVEAGNSFQKKPLAQYIKGVVLETDKKGVFTPLPGANIVWLGTNSGATTDSTGIFTIRQEAGISRLVISYTGYSSDTLTVTDTKEIKIILGSNKQLSEVVVQAKQRSTYLSATNPIRTQIMTDKELFKAACCNLSESFETNPSVDVSYNDAVTGSKQIQLLGLSGNYTQLTVENLPGPRGIATPLGLNSIAGPWVESIQLTKGIGSVANGYESIAGQINVELKKPENSEKLYANAYINDFGKTDLNLNVSKKIGKKWSTGLLLHDDFITNKNLDFNKDGFRDLPTGNQFGLVNRWKHDDGKGFLTQFGIKVLSDRRTGGETVFNAVIDKNTTNHYGLGINTDRYEIFAKIGYVFPEKKYKSIGLQLSAI